MSYALLDVLSDDIVVLRHPEYGSCLWAVSTLRRTGARRSCHECFRLLVAGDRVFRPQTNGTNRMDRICPRCIERLRARNASRATEETK